MLLAVSIGAAWSCATSQPQRDDGERFHHSVIDFAGPTEPWGKTVGDLNGDGLPDLIVGGHSPRRLTLGERILRKLRLKRIEWPTTSDLVWYENPTWARHLIVSGDGIRTDIEVADVDRDGRNDVIALTDGGLVWFKNPEWTSITIDQRTLHDLEVRDFDDDGDIDIVARDQSGFGHNAGNLLHFYRQDAGAKWVHWSIDIPHGEGLRAADLDGDGTTDVVVNDIWLRNPGVLAPTSPWPATGYGAAWQWPDVFIDVADINADGRQDIVLAPSEPVGKRYRISWFEAPPAGETAWSEHVVAPDIETVRHFVAARDLDNDGKVDIVTAAMAHGEDPGMVSVYWNQNGATTWRLDTIATTGSHSMRVVDVDNDGDLDLFGANFAGDQTPIELWENRTCPPSLDRWTRQVIDPARPGRAVFVTASDIDQDGHTDILTGAWWYRNPGTRGGTWQRRAFGTPANNLALVMDFDRDGDPDILASTWKDPMRPLWQRVLGRLGNARYRFQPVDGSFVWARNDGQGRFDMLHNVDRGDGDFLQGVAPWSDGDTTWVGLSWHAPGFGVQTLQLPHDPARDQWQWRRITEVSQDEALSAGDIDGDGDVDLVLGTKWLRNDGDGTWTSFVLFPSDGNPDRNRLADVNGDGILDVVVGYEAISRPGLLAWYQQGPDPTQPWREHPIATVIGPMSLSVVDIDKDGDQDLIVGEHNLDRPETARLILFENVDGTALRWREHVIHTGDEHHDGAQAADIDGDGDADIVSIGFGHRRVLLYRNDNLTGRCPPVER